MVLKYFAAVYSTGKWCTCGYEKCRGLECFIPKGTDVNDFKDDVEFALVVLKAIDTWHAHMNDVHISRYDPEQEMIIFDKVHFYESKVNIRAFTKTLQTVYDLARDNEHARILVGLGDILEKDSYQISLESLENNYAKVCQRCLIRHK